jgi:hypothetical protein
LTVIVGDVRARRRPNSDSGPAPTSADAEAKPSRNNRLASHPHALDGEVGGDLLVEIGQDVLRPRRSGDEDSRRRDGSEHREGA